MVSCTQELSATVVDLLDADELDVRDDVLRGAEIEHFLRLGDAADPEPTSRLFPAMGENACTGTGSGGAPTSTIMPRSRSMPRYLS
jgi:hypothetical protein